MFSDPNVAVMAMIMLCFAGMIIMFIFVIRVFSSQGAEMREAFRKQQMYLSDLERQVQEISFALRSAVEGEGSLKSVSSLASPPAETLPRSDQELMSMLDAATRNKPGQTLDLGDALLSPPSVSRPLSEEYDPAKDPHLFEDSVLSQSGKGERPALRGTVGGKGRPPLSITLDD